MSDVRDLQDKIMALRENQRTGSEQIKAFEYGVIMKRNADLLAELAKANEQILAYEHENAQVKDAPSFAKVQIESVSDDGRFIRLRTPCLKSEGKIEIVVNPGVTKAYIKEDKSATENLLGLEIPKSKRKYVKSGRYSKKPRKAKGMTAEAYKNTIAALKNGAKRYNNRRDDELTERLGIALKGKK